MPVKLNSSGGGSVTIDVPSTASSYTLTAPAVSANLLTSSSQSIPKAALPTGSILQVIQISTGSSYSVTSTTFTATGWTGSITPQYATSKILVSISGGQWRITTNALQEGWAQLWRSIGGGAYSALGQTGGSAGGSGDIHEILIPPANNPFAVSHSLIYLDSPATTSQVTYQPYAKTNSSGTTIYYNMSSPVMLMTLMEIAA